MASSRLEELIEEIYEFIEDCKTQRLSSGKVIVPKDELYDYLDELRLRTPDEIKRYQKMLENRDAILTDANEKAEAMLQEAQQKMDALVDEHEIMQQAYAQADQIVQEAEEHAQQVIAAAEHDAHQIRVGAISYTDDMLAGLENIMDKAYNDCRNHYTGLMKSMEENMNIVRANHRELNGTNEQEPAPAEEPQVQNTEQEDAKVVHHEGVLVDDYALGDEY